MENPVLIYLVYIDFLNFFIRLKYYGMNGFRENYQGLPILKAERDWHLAWGLLELKKFPDFRESFLRVDCCIELVDYVKNK